MIYFGNGVWQLSELEVFGAAKCVKVNPDSPQKQVRFLTLNSKLWCLHSNTVCIYNGPSVVIDCFHLFSKFYTKFWKNYIQYDESMLPKQYKNC